jgi:hypothetical protein
MLRFGRGNKLRTDVSCAGSGRLVCLSLFSRANDSKREPWHKGQEQAHVKSHIASPLRTRFPASPTITTVSHYDADQPTPRRQLHNHHHGIR